MSIQLPNLVATQFEAEVHHEYQSGGSMLRNTVRLKNVQNAKTHTFNVMGAGEAQERTAIQTPIPLMNVTHQPVTVTMKNYTASELTDIFTNEQVPVDERMELAKTIANAFSRREDQLIIDALNAASATNTVANNISGSADNLTLAAIREAAKLLDDDNVPDSERTIIVSPSGLHHLLEDTEVTSADFNNVKALVAGDLDTFYGFKFIKIGSRPEGGLPLSGTDRTCFAYHKSAVGLGLNMAPKIMIDWDQQFGAWRVTGFLSANAVVIDETGMVDIATSEA